MFKLLLFVIVAVASAQTSAVCRHHGSQNARGRCVCLPGWEGITCELNVLINVRDCSKISECGLSHTQHHLIKHAPSGLYLVDRGTGSALLQAITDDNYPNYSKWTIHEDGRLGNAETGNALLATNGVVQLTPCTDCTLDWHGDGRRGLYNIDGLTKCSYPPDTVCRKPHHSEFEWKLTRT